MTASVIQDLSSTIVEGIGSDGNVKVVFDWRQQRAVRTVLENGYFESANASDAPTAWTTAMKEVHSKSKELMHQITQNFYSELGTVS
jgi:hypothetical protein